MIGLFSAVLIASLVGSTHCAGMCGAFVAFAVAQPDREMRSPRLALTAAYNLGRLVTYVTMGAVAGALGAALDFGGSLVGIQQVALSFAAAMLICSGALAAARHLGLKLPRLPLPGFLARWARAGHERAFTFSPIARAGAIGLLTTLLPCGWLYAFVVVAAGTASPAWGAASMAVFWLGTLPMMASLGLGLRALTGSLKNRMPLATSVFLVAAGLCTLLGRAAMPAVTARSFSSASKIESSASILEIAEESCPRCRTEENE